MNKKKSAKLLLLSLSLLSLGQVKADERQSLASIELQAESFLASYPYDSPYEAHFELSKLDSRLNLKPCNEALDIRFSNPAKIMGNTSLKLRCKSPVKWQIHLPARVAVFNDVIMSKTALVKGQSIDIKNIKYMKQDISRLNQGYFLRSTSLKELQVKRNLASNTILNTSHVAPRQLVKSGQKVTIVLNFKGLQIKSSGLALQSASLGQLIKVKNTQTNKIIEGTVSAEGQIRVVL